MARIRRLSIQGIPQIVMIEGNNHQDCFRMTDDYEVYLECLSDGVDKYNVQLHAYCLLPQSIYLLLNSIDDSKSISRLIQYVGRLYVPYFNNKYQRSGTLWQGRYKSCLVEADKYLMRSLRYIEYLPEQFQQRNCAKKYLWSSYRYHAQGKEDFLITPHPLYISISKIKNIRTTHYKNFFAVRPEVDEVNLIQATINSNRVLGSPNFIYWLEKELAVSIVKKRPGRKRKAISLN